MKKEKAILAGGCFWCIESAFSNVVGVISCHSGYTGGHKDNPTYEEVSTGSTGHFEAVEIEFDSEKITFTQILDIFWRQIDPFDVSGQFADRGEQYRTAIFYFDERQKKSAERSKLAVEKLFKKKVATLILPKKPFYAAEEYHQQFCEKQPGRYCQYKMGHEKALHAIWEGKWISHDDMKETLTPLQYKVAVEKGTEEPFSNPYCNNKREGLYVDIISKKPLFISSDKYDSHSGWPSFTRPLHPEEIVEKEDWKLGVLRIEILSKQGTHLGHVFQDGPPPTGLRYCINSAALEFIPKEKLADMGYGKYLSYFH